ncbi:hypothetical protein GC096_03730 [Paenibacillus sp. LMG 31461]|uniref:Uncharacterized protein n=1 Tax=Paenibacillus plantarum TaxID=2654975 RepID=A0ABX1X4J3_9BACL|nr:hypothetical protein [Paenibacillus plantarum]
MPLTKSGISKSIWALREKDFDEFNNRVNEFFSIAYPGFSVVATEYPVIYLRDDRRARRR